MCHVLLRTILPPRFPLKGSAGSVVSICITTIFACSLCREKIKDPKTLSDAVLTGKRFAAQEAFSGGIVQKICPVEVLLVTAVQMGKTALGQHKLDRCVFTELRSNLYSDLVAAYKGHVPDYDNYSVFISQIKSTSKL